jgi:hypothetical protein
MRHGPPPRRGFGVYINTFQADISLFTSLPTPAARTAVVGVSLVFMLVSMLCGVLLADFIYADKIGLEAIHRACWRASLGCLGIVATCGAVIYHYYSINNGGMVSEEHEAEMQRWERTV